MDLAFNCFHKKQQFQPYQKAVKYEKRTAQQVFAEWNDKEESFITPTASPSTKTKETK